MKYFSWFFAAFIAGTALAPLAFGADVGTFRLFSSAGSANQADNLYDEIVRYVRDDALVLPENPEACAYALYVRQNAEKACGDEYARRFSAAEVALMNEEENAPVFWMMSGTVGIIRFSDFGRETAENFMKQAFVLLERGAQELRLDLRDNLGGESGPDLKILYLFAREHDRFETRRYRNKTKIYDTASVKAEFHLAYPSGILRDIPTTVWINGASASASEMVAGAMQDWGYPVLGAVSHGKGIGQTFFELSDGSFVRLTTFEFFAGNSQTKIHGIGVIPNAPLPKEMRE